MYLNTIDLNKMFETTRPIYVRPVPSIYLCNMLHIELIDVDDTCNIRYIVAGKCG